MPRPAVEVDASEPPPYIQHQPIVRGPWAGFKIRGQVALRLPEATRAGLPEFQLPDSASLSMHPGATLTTAPSGNLLLFGGMHNTHLISLNIADINQQRTNHSLSVPMGIYETLGKPPSPRRFHAAACLTGSSPSLVIWGGESMLSAIRSFCDPDLHVFNFGQYCFCLLC